MRVILADDHVMVRDGLRPYVQKIEDGVVVVDVGNVDDAMKQLALAPVDLVILDLKMPGMNGFQGLISIKTQYPDVRCVILSAVADRDHVLESIRLGADGFIPKSLSGAAMVSALQLILSGERFIPAMLVDAHTPQSPSSVDSLPQALLSKLTPRERDILRLLREGLPNKMIATRLDVSEVTVKSHLGNVFRKLQVQNRLQAMRMLVDSEPF